MSRVSIVVTIVATATVYLALHRESAVVTVTPSPVTDSSTSEYSQLTRMLSRISSLERELAALKSEASSSIAQAAVENSPATEPATMLDPAAAASEALARRAADDKNFHAYMDVVERVFLQEKLDPIWANRTTPQVVAAFVEDSALRDLVRDVQCRQHTCRVQIDDTAGSASQRMPGVVSRVGHALPAISADRVDQGDGRVMMVVYLSADEFVPMSRSAM